VLVSPKRDLAEAFQGYQLDEQGMKGLVQDLMELRENPPDPDGVFKAMWPALELQVNAAKQQVPEPQAPQHSMEEMLEEVVERVRRIEREQIRYEPTSGFTSLGFTTSGFGARVDDEARASDHVGS
jgi:hypothetical protein